MKKLLLLDFDGVLFDSSLELTSIVSSIIPKLFKDTLITKFLENLKIIEILNDINLIKQPYQKIKKILTKELSLLNTYYKKFRTYCTDVDDFYVISKILINHIEKNYEKNYEKTPKDNSNTLKKIHLKGLNLKKYNFKTYYSIKEKLKNENKEELNDFIKNFYEKRKFIVENNPHLWLSLNEPFKDSIYQIQKIINKQNPKIIVAILSTKQKYAIEEILNFYNIKIEYVFGKEKEFVDKGKKIIEISKSLKVIEIHFVDDLIHNLLRIKEEINKNKEIDKNLIINLYMSKWGYNSYETRKIATKNNIKIINSLKEITDKIAIESVVF